MSLLAVSHSNILEREENLREVIELVDFLDASTPSFCTRRGNILWFAAEWESCMCAHVSVEVPICITNANRPIRIKTITWVAALKW